MGTPNRRDQCVSCAYPIDADGDVLSVLSRIKGMMNHVGYTVEHLSLDDAANNSMNISLTLRPNNSLKRPRPSSESSNPPSKRASLPAQGCRRCVSSCCSSNSLCRANACNHRNEEVSKPIPHSPSHRCRHHKHTHHHSHSHSRHPHNPRPSSHPGPSHAPLTQPEAHAPDPAVAPAPPHKNHTDFPHPPPHHTGPPSHIHDVRNPYHPKTSLPQSHPAAVVDPSHPHHHNQALALHAAAVPPTPVQGHPAVAAAQHPVPQQKDGWTTSTPPPADAFDKTPRLSMEFAVPTPVPSRSASKPPSESRDHESHKSKTRVPPRPPPELYCHPCARRFETELEFRKHQFLEHPDVREVTKTPEGRFLCLMHSCTQSFVRRHVMERHFKTVHLMVREFACPSCNKSFADSSTREAHRTAVHEKKKPWVCDQCSSCFTQSSSLGKHKRRFHKDSLNGQGQAAARAAQAALNASQAALSATRKR